ncbi:MAG: SDR family oxidoreductase [Deltaproteobacteria bacterium]|nr:SDR family oxidoreductase [Deltaproteobacteria bacterium]
MALETSSLAGRNALVTGASSGIGRAVAQDLLRAGCRVLLTARRTAELAETAHAADDPGPERAVILAGDVARPETAQALAKAVAERWGRLDILVNAAGVGYAGSVQDSDPDQVRRMLDVNLWGLYLVTRAMLPLMPGPGDLVNLASVAGLKFSPGFAMYSASKFAVRAFSEALRNEVQGRGLRVTTVHPGMTDTAFFANFLSGGGSPVPHGQGELLTPEQVAQVIMFALTLPPGAALNEFTLRPTWQPR